MPSPPIQSFNLLVINTIFDNLLQIKSSQPNLSKLALRLIFPNTDVAADPP